ncbi:hypothetical protein IFM89_029666 [Coptis chinensis]|uniref:DCD domain-containing protein n=1 Tax=Coptis chinensis TaxID=261450 RepID=A0A835IH51_9MAGN|nr:hypothetical protein IFM89_029666 [Coptis chinensis]
MENKQESFRQFSDQLRLQGSSFANLSINDSIWSTSATTTYTNKRNEERRNFDIRVGAERSDTGLGKQNGSEINGFNNGWKVGVVFSKPGNNNYNYNYNSSVVSGEKSRKKNEVVGKVGKKGNGGNSNNNNNIGNSKSAVDKRFKTLPPSESLPRSEIIGGYIFVCNNDTMQENLQRQLFGLPPRYRDSVRVITPGLPLFLYNYSNHQLHGVFEASSFGGANIDPTAWGDKKCPGESRFPAQVKVVTRKICNPLEEDSFRPILHHYDGPKFRLELSVPEALALLDVFAEVS